MEKVKEEPLSGKPVPIARLGEILEGGTIESAEPTFGGSLTEKQEVGIVLYVSRPDGSDFRVLLNAADDAGYDCPLLAEYAAV